MKSKQNHLYKENSIMIQSHGVLLGGDSNVKETSLLCYEIKKGGGRHEDKGGGR
jgi:hypothetical protein